MKFIIKPVCQISVKGQLFDSHQFYRNVKNFVDSKQNITGRRSSIEKHGELLTKTGRHNLTFSGKSLALPTSENISIVFKSSLAHNLHSPILGEIPKNFGKTTNP